jgi:phage terminase large subunit-like protein
LALQERLRLTTERNRRHDTNRIVQFFPDTGDLRRELYPKHCQFFALGAEERERGFMAANRVGKTVVGAYEMTCHLTGEYPHWWEGRRFDRPIEAWAAGDTSETTRDIVQKELMGSVGSLGTGMIPAKGIIGEPSKRMGVAGAMDTARVRHIGGGTSILGFKSFDQRRAKFQGTGKHVIWLDEEPEMAVYSECLLRTMTTDGIIMLTFTPLLGLSDVALKFLPELAPTVEGSAA